MSPKIRPTLSGTTLQILITTMCGLDFALFGYDQGVFGGVLLMPGFEHDFPQVMSDAGLQGVVSSLYTLGCFFGACFAFVVAERLGRKRSIFMGLTLLLIGTILQTTAFSVAHLIVGRLVTGFGNGITTAVVPVYQAETSKAQHRGQLVVVELALNIVGYSTSNWATYGLLHLSKTYDWRITIALQAFFILSVMGILPFLPESPRWLVAHDKRDEARRVLALLQGYGLTKDDPKVVQFEGIIHETVKHEVELGGVSWREIFKRGKLQNFRRVALGAAMQFMQQFTGINVFSYYLPITLEQTLGYSKLKSSLVSCINSVTYFCGSLAPILYIERAGRKKTLIGGATSQSVCCIMLAAALAMVDRHPNDRTAYGLWAVAFIFIYQISFGASWLSVPWLYPAEVNSLRLRSKGAAVGTASDWLSNYIVVQFTPPGQKSLGWKFYIMFAVFNAAFVPIVMLFFPESKGRSLEQMDALFEGLEGKITVLGVTPPPIDVIADKLETNRGQSDVEGTPPLKEPKTEQESSVQKV